MSCFRAFRQLHNRSSTGAGSDIRGGRSVENLRWTTARCVVHTFENWGWCSAVFPLLEIPQNAAELVGPRAPRTVLNHGLRSATRSECLPAKRLLSVRVLTKSSFGIWLERPSGSICQTRESTTRQTVPRA
jgi:hypothetical protein